MSEVLIFKTTYPLYSHDILRNPYSYELLNNYGVALLEAGRLRESEVALKASIHYSPRYWPAYSNEGLVYERMHQYDKAKQYYWLAIGMSQYFTTYEDLAQLTFQTEPPAYVVPILQQALALYPYNPKLLAIAAKTYDKLGKEDLARLYAQKAVELDSGMLQDPVIQRLTGN